MSDILAAAIQAALLRIEEGQQQMRGDVAVLRTAVDDRLQLVEKTVIDLRVVLMDRMDRLQDTLTGIRDDVGVNMHHSDRVRQAHDNTREELRSMGDSVAQLLIRLRKVEDAVRVLRGDT